MLLMTGAWALAQTAEQPAAPQTTASPPATAGGSIQGMVKSGNMPIPGAAITAANTLTGQKVVTWTDVNGQYALQVPADGRYVVKAQMAAFAPATGEVLINATNRSAKVDLEIVLLSRAQQAAQEQQRQASAGGNRGFQSLSVTQGEVGGDFYPNGNSDQAVQSEASVPGMSLNAATESVAVSGNASGSDFSTMSSDEMRQRMQEYRDQQGGGFRGGPPGGGGPAGGGGGGGPMIMFGGRGRFDINRPHGTVYYTAGNDALNAAPYSLTGQPVNKSGYMQNRFGVSLGGPLNIPGIYKGGDKTFFFFNYNGSHGDNPYDAFSTVPTGDERNGNFSNSTILTRDSNGNPVREPVQIFSGASGPCNTLQSCGLAIDSVAQGLLKYLPLRNLPGVDVQNFHFVSSATSNSNDLNVRLMHALGGASIGPRRRRGPQNNLTFGLHYHTVDSGITNPFPSVGGANSVRSIDVPVGYIRSFGKLTNIFRVDFNRSRTQTQNLYAFQQNVAGNAGVTGISQNPFDWGLPNLSFTDFGSLNDANPQLVRNQTISFSDNLIWNHGKHTLRWGGDFRRIQLNTEASNDARGTFVFTGLNTSQQGVPNTGFDFADFLIGDPQQTRLQSTQPGANNYHFRGNSWDLYAQDEWKLRGNLTLNFGLRYEYVSPFTELNNRIANLILSPAFLTDPNVTSPNSVTAVEPGATGYPASLMHPDRNNFAPRVGVAWKLLSKTVVRAGYGINYNTGAYQNIVQQLAFQPPFAVTETNVQAAQGQLTLRCGFPPPTASQPCGTAPPSGQITNNYAVDPNYRLGYVQIWNLNVQQELRPTLLLNLDYTGTKGTALDILEAPNRDLKGIRLPNVDSFNRETSRADSHANAATVRLRKRLQHGVSIGGSYTWSKSIDDASNIGGSASVVAQNSFDLAAERSLSSFDQRHRFTADYLVELPFGHDKPWLNQNGMLRTVFGDWQWSGDWTIASGTPSTPRVLGNFADVNRGTNGTLRADVTGLPVSLPNPTVTEWFNTAAFVVPPAGQYGNARRNSILGPGTVLFDMAFTKVFPIKDTRVLELRAQASNIFNTPHFAAIDTVVNSPTFGQVISVGSMRAIQLTARFRF